MAEENQTQTTDLGEESAGTTVASRANDPNTATTKQVTQRGDYLNPETTAFYEDLRDFVTTRIESPNLPEPGKIDFKKQEVEQDELLNVTQMPSIQPATVASVDPSGLSIPKPATDAVNTYTAFTEEGTPEFTAAKGTLSSGSLVGDVVGAVSQESIAQAATEELDERATVKFQLGQLFSSLEEGKPLPAWAAPAVRTVGAEMAKRGLGASSMAAAAITQSLMESGVPIAAQDAKTYSAIQLQNLNNKQQASLQNAMTYAAMDKANLDARLQTAVNNARSFLQMDVANLSSEQAMLTIDLQSKYQKLVSDSAAQNAARAFNSKSTNQINEFYTELETQIDTANTARETAIRQYNAGESNVFAQFNASLSEAREHFNVNQQNAINQSNAVWRRNLNTANTAGQNEVNRQNAINVLNLNQDGLNRMWQKYRDDASWIYNSAENALQRDHQIALYAQQEDDRISAYDRDLYVQTFKSLGSGVMATVFPHFEKTGFADPVNPFKSGG
jgi:biotin operon repressor